MKEENYCILKNFGWNDKWQNKLAEMNLSFKPARVISQHSNLFKVISDEGELLAEKAGRFDYFVESEIDLPIVGDWVLVDIFKDDNKAVIHKIIPRENTLSRKKAGNKNTIQAIAANIDMAFIVTGLDNNYNINRVERYITLVHNGRIKPVLVFNKTDMAESLDRKKEEIGSIFKNITVLFTSAEKRQGLDQMLELLEKNTTVCFLGSSGVGKSSLINLLLGEDIIKTNKVRKSDSKGRHTTSARQIYSLPTGALVIDTPGMRELGLCGDEDNLQNSFDGIVQLSESCRFSNCRHITEPGCAVLMAIDNGELERERYDSYMKQRKELEFIQMKKESAGSYNPKKRWKNRSKLIKRIKEK